MTVAKVAGCGGMKASFPITVVDKTDYWVVADIFSFGCHVRPNFLTKKSTFCCLGDSCQPGLEQERVVNQVILNNLIFVFFRKKIDDHEAKSYKAMKLHIFTFKWLAN